jgi:hypothetical protein
MCIRQLSKSVFHHVKNYNYIRNLKPPRKDENTTDPAQVVLEALNCRLVGLRKEQWSLLLESNFCSIPNYNE